MKKLKKVVERIAILVVSGLAIFEGVPKLLNVFKENRIYLNEDGSISIPFLANYLSVIKPSILVFGLGFLLLGFMYLSSLRSGYSHRWFSCSNSWVGSLAILLGCIGSLFVLLYHLAQPISFLNFIVIIIFLSFILRTTSVTVQFMRFEFNS